MSNELKIVFWILKGLAWAVGGMFVAFSAIALASYHYWWSGFYFLAAMFSFFTYYELRREERKQ